MASVLFCVLTTLVCAFAAGCECCKSHVHVQAYGRWYDLKAEAVEEGAQAGERIYWAIGNNRDMLRPGICRPYVIPSTWCLRVVALGEKLLEARFVERTDAAGPTIYCTVYYVPELAVRSDPPQVFIGSGRAKVLSYRRKGHALERFQPEDPYEMMPVSTPMSFIIQREPDRDSKLIQDVKDRFGDVFLSSRPDTMPARKLPDPETQSPFRLLTPQ